MSEKDTFHKGVTPGEKGDTHSKRQGSLDGITNLIKKKKDSGGGSNGGGSDSGGSSGGDSGSSGGDK